MKLYTLIIATIILYNVNAGYSAEQKQTVETNNVPVNIDIMTLRDPFWPSGWRPPNFGKKKTAAEITSPIKWHEAASLLRIAGLTKKPNGNYIAIIKGYGLIEKGDTLTVNYQGLIYTWKITNITSKGIERKKISVSM
jgi:hypothetical protein